MEDFTYNYENGYYNIYIKTDSVEILNQLKKFETIEAIANKLTKEKFKNKLKGIYQVKDLIRIVEVITGNTDKIKIKKAIKIYLTNEQIYYKVHRDRIKLRKGYRF